MTRSDVVFFASGLAALAHETAWARILARSLGSDAGGAAVVLASYMAGLGLGARLFAGPARRLRQPRLAFGLLEAFIALWAAASPWFLGAIEAGVLGESLAARGAAAGLALLPPTLAMGATFPLMGRLTLGAEPSGSGASPAPGHGRAAEDSADTAATIGGFYGANTLGAAAGALLAPFVTMPWLGLTGSLRASAVIGLVAALAARWLPPAPSAPAAQPRSELPTEPARRRGAATPALAARSELPAAWRYLAITFALGFAALSLEVLMTRLLITVTGASVYAFALVLFVFLLGIGLGSRQLASTPRRALESAERAPRLVLGTALAVAPLALFGALCLRFQLGEADLFAGLTNRLPSGASTVRLWASHALFAGLALLAPAIAFGMALPATATCLIERVRPESAVPREHALGRVYAANTLGALAGALAAAFVLLPALGLRVGLAVALAIPLVGAAVLLRRRAELAAWGAALVVSVALGALLFRPASGARVLAQAHGRHATAAVEENQTPSGPVRALRVNGKVVATTAPVDLRLQRLLGLVPALLHGDVREALVIGLGTGMTAGSLTALSSLERLDVFEISESVVAVAPHFAAWNSALTEDPRVVLRIADGRFALARSSRRWDLITADPIHPWTKGSSDLYSLEHFTAIAEHLAPGGIASQWLPLYQLSSQDVRTIVATWIAAFPHASAWITAYDLALIGSLDPLGEAADAPDGSWTAGDALDRLRAAWSPQVAAELAPLGIHGPAELTALWVGDRARLAAFADGEAPMRDDRPVLEFRAPKSYLAGYSTAALAWAADEAPIEVLARFDRPAFERARAVRAHLRAFLADLPQGYERAAARYGERLLALPPLDAHH